MTNQKYLKNQTVSVSKEKKETINGNDTLQVSCSKESVVLNTEGNQKKQLKASQLSKLKELERENTELKKMYAELSMENRTIKNLIQYLQNTSPFLKYHITKS